MFFFVEEVTQVELIYIHKYLVSLWNLDTEEQINITQSAIQNFVIICNKL